MAILKLHRLSPQQIEALATLANQFPETFALPMKDGRPQHFEFPITELDTVHLYAMRAGKRSVDLGLYDLSDEVIEFDQEYSNSKDAWVINLCELEFLPGKISAIKNAAVGYHECIEVLLYAGYWLDKAEQLIEHISEYPEVKWILLAAFLINNPQYLAKDELPQLDGYQAKIAELETFFETAIAA